MSQSYFFYDQAGTIPGVPGTFSRCRVDIDDEGNVTTFPPVKAGEMQPAEPIQEATNVQEQEQAPLEESEPAPNTNNQEG